VLKGERAAYGEQIVSALWRDNWRPSYGRGFSSKNLRHMLRFAEAFPDAEHCLRSAETIELDAHQDPDLHRRSAQTRLLYCRCASRNVGAPARLQERLDSLLFERTALSRQPDKLLSAELAALREAGDVTPALVLKDPYILDYLGLKDRYLEKDLEDAILRELENFLLELGAGFTFVARQKRLQIDNDDFYIDLLFYNRRLKRLVAIDLKLGDFKAADKGQMELYLRWLAKHEQEPGEASQLDIILCAAAKNRNKSNCWNWITPASTSPNTSLNCRLRPCCNKNCMRPSLIHATRLDNLGGSEV
jgi:predicted nuclease of restriction endonuclease-like (RecB) superfamily